MAGGFNEMKDKAEELIDTGNEISQSISAGNARVAAAKKQVEDAKAMLEAASEKDENGNTMGNISAARAIYDHARNELASARHELQILRDQQKSNNENKRELIGDMKSYTRKEHNNLDKYRSLSYHRFSELSSSASAETAKRINIIENTRLALIESMGEHGTADYAGISGTGFFKGAADRPRASADMSGKRRNTFFSTYEERLAHTPPESTYRGEWEGARGESKFIPDLDNSIAGYEAYEKLDEFGLDGIVYREGVPDFTPCAIETVEISMSADRYSNIENGIAGNFEKADAACAAKWNKQGKNGRHDWTARDVKNFRSGGPDNMNKYSWHECNDSRTCQLLPVEIHSFFTHLGGVGEIKRSGGNS